MDEFDAAAAGAGIAKRVVGVAGVAADPADIPFLVIFLVISVALRRRRRRRWRNFLQIVERIARWENRMGRRRRGRYAPDREGSVGIVMGSGSGRCHLRGRGFCPSLLLLLWEKIEKMGIKSAKTQRERGWTFSFPAVYSKFCFHVRTRARQLFFFYFLFSCRSVGEDSDPFESCGAHLSKSEWDPGFHVVGSIGHPPSSLWR